MNARMLPDPPTIVLVPGFSEEDRMHINEEFMSEPVEQRKKHLTEWINALQHFKDALPLGGSGGPSVTDDAECRESNNVIQGIFGGSINVK